MGGGVVLDLLRQGVSVKVIPDTTVVVDLGTIAIACVVRLDVEVSLAVM